MTKAEKRWLLAAGVIAGLGVVTATVVAVTRKKTLASALVEAALKDRGLIEQGDNEGPRIKQILANVGIFGPANWCAAAVSTWIFDAAAALGVSRPIPGSAGVLALMTQFQSTAGVSWLPATVAKAQPSLVQLGMVAIWSRGVAGSGLGHTGVVVAVDGLGGFTTIEGNAGPAADRVVLSTHDVSGDNFLGMGILVPNIATVGAGYFSNPPGVFA